MEEEIADPRSMLREFKQQDKDEIKNFITKLIKKKEYHWFIDKVEQTEDNGLYYKIITKPMYLRKVLYKLEHKKYILIQQVYDDLMLIWDNCRTYNTEDSEVHKSSITFEDEVNKFFKDSYDLSSIAKLDKSKDKNENIYSKIFDENKYKEEEFNDPDYYKLNPDKADEDPIYHDIADKILIRRRILKLIDGQRKKLIKSIKDDFNLKNYIVYYKDDNVKGHIRLKVEYFKANDIEKINQIINRIENEKECTENKS